MILAAIGGVQGRLPALQAVLDDIDREGIESIICTGDVAVGHGWPNEVIDLLQQRHIRCVQGARDRQVVRFLRKQKSILARTDDDEYSALTYTYEQLSSGHLEYLRGLKKDLLLAFDGIEVLLCHGSPANPSDILLDSDANHRYQRQREVASAPIIVHGGTALPHVRRVLGTLFVNPGALAMDAARPGHASYAVVSTESEPWAAEIRFVAYDTAAKTG